jgi:hypothetical protein
MAEGESNAIVARNASKLFLDGAVVAFRALDLSGARQEILASSARAAAARPRSCAASPG